MKDNGDRKKLIQTFFYPAVALMNRLNVTQKFMLLGMMSLVAIAVVVYSLFGSLNQVIGVSQRELQGIEIIKQFPRTIQTLQQHRGLSAVLLGGDVSLRAYLDACEIDTAAAFSAMEKKLPSDLISSTDYRRFKADWLLLRKEGLNWTQEENFAAHTLLIDRIHSFEVRVADEYMLITDPKLDTYYLIDTIVNHLPRALEQLGQLRAYSIGILARKQITEQQKLEINLLMVELENKLEDLTSHLDKTGRYNPALQVAISAAARNISQSGRQITNFVASDILAGNIATPANYFFGISTSALAKGYAQLYDALLPSTETLIKARLKQAENTLRVSIGIASLLFLVVAYFSTGICRIIIINIKSIAHSAHAFAGGDLSERIDCGTHDEFDQLGDSFNEMADGFGKLLKISRENEVRLQDMSANLEKRVKERTLELEENQRATELLLRRNQALMLTSMDGIHVMSMQGDVLAANDAFCRMLGYTREEINSLNVIDWDAQLTAEELREKFLALLGRSALFETLYRRKDGATIHAEISASGVELDGQNFIFASSRDITARKQIEAVLRRHKQVIDTSIDGFWMADMNGYLLEANQAYTQMSGYSLDELQGMHVSQLDVIENTHEEVQAHIARVVAQGYDRFETRHRHKDGHEIDIEVSVTHMAEAGWLFVFCHDITERKHAEQEIHNLAFYDPLTQLPNRRLFIDRFHAALPASARYNNYGAVLFIDLDKFKALNDTLGHDYGDLLLIEVSTRVKSCIREMDVVARLGGDEFVVLVEDISIDRDDASRKAGFLAEKIRDALARPYRLKEHEYSSSPSIGISLFHGNQETIDTLLQHADLAMYQAKNAGRNAVRIYDVATQNDVAAHTDLVNDLRQAVARRQLHLFYQIHADSENHPLFAQALLRWRHPERGMVMPEEFIPIAEKSSLIIELDDWVLETACRQLALWSQNALTKDLLLTVNVSAKQFDLPDFVEKISDRLKSHKINPGRLKLELTQSSVLDDLILMTKKMRALKMLGVSLSMDNFGAHDSSQPFLNQLAVNKTKKDMGFVSANTRSNDALLVHNIIDLMNIYN